MSPISGVDRAVLLKYIIPMTGEAQLAVAKNTLELSGKLGAEDVSNLYDEMHENCLAKVTEFLSQKSTQQKYDSIPSPRFYAPKIGERLRDTIESVHGIDVFSKPPEKPLSLLSWVWSYLPKF